MEKYINILNENFFNNEKPEVIDWYKESLKFINNDKHYRNEISEDLITIIDEIKVNVF